MTLFLIDSDFKNLYFAFSQNGGKFLTKFRFISFESIIKNVSLQINGGPDRHGNGSQSSNANRPPNQPVRNYKLISDPFIVKGAPKVYRYDGVVPGDQTHPTVIPRDPRNTVVRIRPRQDVELTLPRYLYIHIHTIEFI